MKSRKRPPRKAKQLRNPELRRARSVLRRIRGGDSLTHASSVEHIAPRTVLKHIRNKVRRSASGRYVAKRSRRLKREINVFGVDGYEPVTVGSSKQARLASEHLNAINRFLRTGDTGPLKRIRGKSIGGIELLTDPKRIREFAEADLVKLDGLYRDQRGRGRRK